MKVKEGQSIFYIHYQLIESGLNPLLNGGLAMMILKQDLAKLADTWHPYHDLFPFTTSILALLLLEC